MKTIDEVLAGVKTDLAVEITSDMFRIPSVVEDEEKIGLYLYDKMKSLGFDGVELQEVFPKRYNAICRVKGNRPGKTMVLTGHMDNKPVCEGWTEDPFSGDLRDDKIYGHGVMDMKAGLASQIAAAYSIKEMGCDFAGEIIVGGVCDHMGPQQKGAVELFKKIKGDVCILGELTNSNLCLGHRGREYIDISTIGLSAHTCQKYQAINAIKTMVPVVEELLKLKLFPEIEPYVAQLMGDELYTEVGRIFGGLWPGGPSMIPDKCTIRLDTRPQPGVDFSYIENAVNEALERAKAKDPEVKLEVVIADKKKPYMISPDSKLIPDMKKAMKIVQKKEPVVYAESWLADTSSFGDQIDTILFGPGGGAVYMPNEFLPAQDVRDAAQIYTLATLFSLDSLR